jgi:ATP diphosphatase
MSDIERLLEIMALLRDPQRGCPWDLEQRFETIAPYTIEEAYEVDDAIRRGDLGALCEELGDLLLQVVFHAQLAREAGAFDFGAVVERICEKLVRRHPHVFARERIGSAAAQLEAWDGHKQAERADRARREGRAPSAMDDVPPGLPALLRAAKLQRRAERAGLDWESEDGRARALAALVGGLDAHSAGEWLFALARLATRAGVDPETAAREAGARFEQRFRALEAALGPAERAPEQLRAAWRRAEPA